MENIDLEFLIGKTIVKAEYRNISDKYDDEPYLDLVFSDGTACTIVGDYGGYSGNSIDEYSRSIYIKEIGYTEK